MPAVQRLPCPARRTPTHRPLTPRRPRRYTPRSHGGALVPPAVVFGPDAQGSAAIQEEFPGRPMTYAVIRTGGKQYRVT
ncbi:MAG: hypothetical protein ACK5AZ_26445, partial [Bryobacteraceae bacterium]